MFTIDTLPPWFMLLLHKTLLKGDDTVHQRALWCQDLLHHLNLNCIAYMTLPHLSDSMSCQPNYPRQHSLIFWMNVNAFELLRYRIIGSLPSIYFQCLSSILSTSLPESPNALIIRKLLHLHWTKEKIIKKWLIQHII